MSERSKRKNLEAASQPLFSSSLRYHLKPRQFEGDLKEKRKDRRSNARSRRRFPVDENGGGAQTKATEAPKAQPRPEPVAGWITRAEARSVLGIEESELAALIDRFRIRPNLVEVYSKPEILALREIVAKLR
jgi:hypothetical protein